MNNVPHNEDGAGFAHLYMPWWLDNKKVDFPRGYHIEFGGGRRMPTYGFLGGIQYLAALDSSRPPDARGYGKSLKDDYRRYYGATLYFAGRGEMVPNDDTYCEIDPDVVDRWGIPVLRFHFKWTDHEYKQVKHMHETFRAIVAEMGGTPLGPMPTAEDGYGIEAGRANHPRARVRENGERSADVGAERQLPGARSEEPVRRRRRPVRVAGRQEPDVDDPRARDADVCEYIAEQRKGGAL